MNTFLLAACFCMSVVYTAVSAEDPDRGLDTDTLEYLIRRIEVLENRDMKFREEFTVMRRKQERQGREIANLRRLLGDRLGRHKPQEKVAKEDRKRSDTENTEAHATYSGIERSDDHRQTIRQTEVDVNVAFFATLSSNTLHLGKNQNVVFDHIETNEANAYNPHVGVFIAPVSGTYVFSTTATILERSVAHFAFSLNGRHLTNMYVNGVESFYESSTQTIVLKLNQGDDVSVVHTDSDKNVAGSNYSIFSGFLLRQSSASTNIVG